MTTAEKFLKLVSRNGGPNVTEATVTTLLAALSGERLHPNGYQFPDGTGAWWWGNKMVTDRSLMVKTESAVKVGEKLPCMACGKEAVSSYRNVNGVWVYRRHKPAMRQPLCSNSNQPIPTD